MGFESELIGCFIPECNNTSGDDQGKRFVPVPTSPELRQLWIQAGLRLKVKLPITNNRPLYCCQDHFDLNQDGVKQSVEEIQQSTLFISINRGILPHKFPSNEKTPSKDPFKKRCVVNDVDGGGGGGWSALSSHFNNPSSSNQSGIEKNSSHVPSLDTFDNQLQSTFNPEIGQDSTFEINNGNRSISIKNINIGDANDEYEIQIIENDKTIFNDSDEKLVGIPPTNNVIGSDKLSSNDSGSEMYTKAKLDYSGNDRYTKATWNGGGVETLSKRCIRKAIDSLSLKRKIIRHKQTLSNMGTIDSAFNMPTNTHPTKKKKRKVIKEILAWIPSDPSFVSVPHSQSKSNCVPSVASIPLNTDKVTQFVISVPENSSTNCLTSQVMLAVPQGCSYSIDKLPLSNEVSKTKGNSNDCVDVSSCTSETDQIQNQKLMESYTADTECIEHLSKSNICNTDHNQADCCSKTVMDKSVPRTSLNHDTETRGSQLFVSKASSTLPVKLSSCMTVASDLVTSTDSTASQPNLSTTLHLIQTELTSMIQLVDSLRKEISLLKSHNLRLREQIKTKDHQISVMTLDKTKRLELVAVELKRVFTANQIRMLLEESNERCRVTWTQQELATASSFYRISPHAYKVLHNDLKYPFPSVTTVKRYIEKKEWESKRSRWTVGASRTTVTTPVTDHPPPFYDPYDSDQEVYKDEKALRQSIAQQMLNHFTTSSNGFDDDTKSNAPSFIENTAKNFKTKAKEKIIIVSKPTMSSAATTPVALPVNMQRKIVEIQKPTTTINGTFDSRIRQDQHNFILDKNVSDIISVDSQNDIVSSISDRSKEECSPLVSNICVVEGFQMETDSNGIAQDKTDQDFVVSNDIVYDEDVSSCQQTELNVNDIDINSPLTDENIMCQEIVIHCDSPTMLHDQHVTLTFN